MKEPRYPRLCAFYYLLSYLPASPRPFINIAAKFEVSNIAVGQESRDFSRHPWQRKECLRSQIQSVSLFGLKYYFGDANYRLSAHLALRDLIRLIAAGTAFIV